MAVAVAIVDNHGSSSTTRWMDDIQIASANVAIEKAKTSANVTPHDQGVRGRHAGGRNVTLGLPGVTPIEGGIPLVEGVTWPTRHTVVLVGADADALIRSA